MRIALITDTYTPQINGVTTIVTRIARMLRGSDHAVAVVAPAYPGAAPPEGDGELRVRSLPPLSEHPSVAPPPGRIAAFLDVFAPIALARPAAGLVLLPLTGLVAYSRVALRTHHLSDVLAGALLGIGGAIAATSLLG